MKKILIALALVFSTGLVAHSQTTKSKKHKKAKTTTSVSAQTSGAHLNKDGTPDQRYKSNKKETTAAPEAVTFPKPRASRKKKTEASAATPAAPQTQSPVAPVKRTSAARRTSSPDKAIGTDSKGRTIYQGPRGGKYYLTKNGNKEYVK